MPGRNLLESIAYSEPSDGSGRSGLIDRLLDFAGGDDPELCHMKLHAFRRAVLLYGALRSWLWMAGGAGDQLQGLPLSATGLSLCCALSVFSRAEVMATRGAAAIVLFQIAQTFPLTHNHLFLEFVAVAILSIARRDRPREEALALQALQWLCAIVLFHTGLQKVLYGLYFRGEFLAFMIGQTDRFASLFEVLLEESEILRLRSYSVWTTEAGPYLVGSIPFRLASNLVYFAELGLAPLLLVRRTRIVAAVSAIALVLAIQAGARELGFAFLFINLLLLFPERDWNRRLLPIFFVLGAVALGAALDWLPGRSFMATVSP